MAGKLVEYPFDTLKVRLQTGSYSGAVECVTSVIKEEGILAFYRGLATPLVGSGLEVSTLFFGFRLMEKLLKKPEEREMTLGRVFLSGAGAGLGSTVILTPVELIKCRLQVKNDYAGPIDCIKRTVAAEGVSGMYRGALSTMLREVPGNGAWFAAYHFFGRTLAGKESVKDGTQMTQLCAGGLAGMFYWGVPYPLDTIKSEVQTMPRGTSTWAVGMKLIQQRGIAGLYRGCGVTLVRAFPGNAVTFWMYERVMNFIHPVRSH